MQARAPDEGPSGEGLSASTVGGQVSNEDMTIAERPDPELQCAVSEKNEIESTTSLVEACNKTTVASTVGGQPSSVDLVIEERHNPKLLRAVSEKYRIDSTMSLVEAYNKTTDKDELAVLLGWLNKYGEQKDEYIKPKGVLEYAELANIIPRFTHDKNILSDLIQALYSCICQENFRRPNYATALYGALNLADPSSYGGVAELVVIARKLLGSLSAEPRLTKENFAKYEVTFLALRQTFLLLSETSQTGVCKEEKHELRRAVAEKERAMELSCEHYPVRFHFKTLRQAVERFRTEDASSHLESAMQHIGCGLCVFLYVLHCVRNLARGDVDPEDLQDAYAKARAAVANMGVSKKPWFDTFKNLIIARQKAAKDEANLELFESVYSAAMERQRNMSNEEELKALRYGIVCELGTLALEGLSENVRDDATKKLVNLATQQTVNEGWTDDSDILIALLDVLSEIHRIGQCNEDEDTKNALLVLHQSCKGSSEEALAEWLGGNSIEDRLRERSLQSTTEKRKDLCIKTGRDAGYIPLAIVDSKREELRNRYLRNHFATVTSLFGDGLPKHVKDMEHHIVISEEIIQEQTNKSKEGNIKGNRGGEAMEGKSSDHRVDQAKEYYEKKMRVTKPIALDDLFKRRSLKPGDPEIEVRRVLLYGNPGAGKTCITKVIAHKWALGEMAQEFKAVYVVPVRVLNTTEPAEQKLSRLEGAISKICFCGSPNTFKYEDLLLQVEDDLNDPSTLLVLDGLDEANDHTRELVSTVWKRSCKVLLLSRPYNMRDLETRVDIQVECLGFNDEQLRDYVKSELSEKEAPKFIRSLYKNTAMWEMAHIPVTAHILCSLSKEHGDSFEKGGKGTTTFQIYNEMANYVWKRFEEKPAGKNIKKVELFRDLEKIAFKSLRNGDIYMDERFVMLHATSKNAAQTFKESGLLLLVLEGKQYQFPHLTFQEYFAGRYIARMLKQKGSDEETRVLDFIHKGKYDKKHDLMLTFAMHAFAESRNKQALKELLSIVDTQPVEVLGVRHLFLRMRVLEATLEEADNDELDVLTEDKQAIALVDSARQLLESTIDHDTIREIVFEEIKQLSRVLEQFPRLLAGTVDRLKNTIACSGYLYSEEMVKIHDVLKLTAHSPEHSDALPQLILQIANDVHEASSRDECIDMFESIVTQAPQFATKLLPTLVRMCGDEDENVRWTATRAIYRVVGAAPQHASDYLPTLAKGCGDEDFGVCRAAMEVFDSVVGEAPRNADRHLPTLARESDDDDDDYDKFDDCVRQVATEAINLVFDAAQRHGGELLQTLAMGYIDKEWHVRLAAVESIGRLAVTTPQHAGKHLPKLALGCRDEYSSVRRAAIEAIDRVVEAVPQDDAVELLTTLTRVCDDQIGCVRMAAMEAICCVVAAVPQEANKQLAILVKGYGDTDWDVRMAAVEAIGRVLAAVPQLAGKYLPTLEKGCGDNNDDVRMKALKAIGRVVREAPQYADDYFSTLARGSADYNYDVRDAALEAIEDIIDAATKNFGNLLPTLAKRCGDEDLDVRAVAVKAIGRVVAALPQIADDYLLTLATGCGDKIFLVRKAAMEAIGRVVKEAPQHAGHYLLRLAIGCYDENHYVRQAAIKAIGRVVVAAPQHAGDYLPTLARGRDDEDCNVREAAIEAINRVIAAVPQYGGERPPILARGRADEDENIGEAKIKAIEGVVAAATPQNAGEHLPTLAMGYRDKHPHVRQAAIKAIARVIVAAPQHAGEHLLTLARGCDDIDWHVRQVAMEAFDRVVAASMPQHAGEFLPRLANNCSDSNSVVRAPAMEAIGRVVAASPRHAAEYLPTLVWGCGDEYSSVRQAAMNSIGRVVVAAPQHAAEHLWTLARGCGDKDYSVRHAAIGSIGRVVVAAPQHAAEHLATLARGCGDNDYRVRQAAIGSIGRVVEEVPQHAGKLLSALTRKGNDGDWRVRQTAVEAIGHIVVAAPQYAGEYLPTLVRGCGDKNDFVRRAAIKAVGRVIMAAPHRAGELLPTLARRCIDEDSEVCDSARKALECVKLEEVISTAISFPPSNKGGFSIFFVWNSFTLDPPTESEKVSLVSHTTSSREIGKWDKAAISVFVGYLREEFEHEFPRLLKNIIIKE